MNRGDFQRLAEIRLKEARALLEAGCHEGAYYLSGYAVECALKACIARQTKEHDFPDKRSVDKSYTHNLEQLLEVAELTEGLRAEMKRNSDFERYWNSVKDWKESSRYDLSVSEVAARDLYTAIIHVSNGVMQWLKKSW